MRNFIIRVIHIDEKTAFNVFHNFSPLDVVVEGDGYSRKRDGSSQVIIVRGITEEAFDQFCAACLKHPAVVDVIEISEDEFWAAASNSI